jgi:hypothetical protein
MIGVPASVEWIKTVGELKLPVKADQRLQKLMDRNNEGQLTEVERLDLEYLVELSEQLSLVCAEALNFLGQMPNGQ